MTIPVLITTVLTAIHHQFYPDRPREFLRDRQALMRALGRWGHECARRGWDFQPEFIQRQLLDLLNEIKRRSADIQYLPVYLHGAVGRWIGQRAEELSAESKSVPRQVTKLVAGLQRVEAIREPTPNEILATLYRDLTQRRRAARRPAQTRQTTLNL